MFMPIIQPGRGGGIQGRGVAPRCGQGRTGSFRSAPKLGPLFRGPRFYGSFYVAGVTRNATGEVLPSVTVDLYSESRVWLDRGVSDGTGAYRFNNVGVGSVFLVGYLDGLPDVAGVTIRNVRPLPA